MIDPLGANPAMFRAIATPAASCGPAGPCSAPDRAAKPAGDGPQLSGVRDAARDLAAAPPVDAARVAQLKSAIAAGEYHIDPDRIAARMIAADLGGVR